jgi:hypothetical protein
MKYNFKRAGSKRGKKGTALYYGWYPYEGYNEAVPHIFQRDGYVCKECGATLVEDTFFKGVLNYTNFVVHHIDGDNMNQDWDNLTVLCQSCNRKKHNRRLCKRARYSHL